MQEEKELTFAQCFGGSRDACCIAAVGDMAAMGRFDEEFNVYGLAYVANGHITYRVTPKVEDIYRFSAQSALDHIFPTRIHSYSVSTHVQAGMRDKIEREVKFALARKIQQLYPAEFFQQLTALSETPPKNEGYSILATLKDEIDGYFEEMACQLLEGTMLQFFDAKQLQRACFEQLYQWIAKIRRQLADAPSIQNGVLRTFYGFRYKDREGSLKTIVNAQYLSVWSEYMSQKRMGAICAPVLHWAQWFNDADKIYEGRQNFRRRLCELENDSYFFKLEALKKLPSAVDCEMYQSALKCLEENLQGIPIEDFKDYGYRWNCI